MGVSDYRGTVFGGPYNKDSTISGTILGSPIFGNALIPVIKGETPPTHTHSKPHFPHPTPSTSDRAPSTLDRKFCPTGNPNSHILSPVHLKHLRETS